MTDDSVVQATTRRLIVSKPHCVDYMPIIEMLKLPPPPGDELAHLMGLPHYLREFRTIHLSARRQSGKTTTLAQNFDFDHDVVICPNRPMYDSLFVRFMALRCAPHGDSTFPPTKRMFTVRDFSKAEPIPKMMEERGIDAPIKTVWLDEATTMVGKVDVRRMLNRLMHYCDAHSWIIHLG